MFIHAYFIIAFAQTLNIFAQKRATAAESTIIYALEIVFSLIWGVILPETLIDRVIPTPFHIFGAVLIIGAVVVLLVSLACYWFFGTEIGAAVRATGNNPHMIRANGIDTDVMIVLGLLLSNGLVAISGALVAQSNGFADVGMGVGTIVIGLASVIIGEVLFGTRSFKNCLISVILGSIVYRAVIAIVLQMGMPPNDLKLFTAVLVAIALSLPLIQARWRKMRRA